MDAAAEGQLEGQGEIETTLQYFCLKYSIFFEAIFREQNIKVNNVCMYMIELLRLM